MSARHTPVNWFEEREYPINKEKSIYANRVDGSLKPNKDVCVANVSAD